MSKKSIGSRTLKAGAALLAVGAGVAAINAKNKNGTEKKEIKEIQKKEYEQYRNTERGKYDKNSKGIYYSNGNYEAFARPEKPEGVDAKSAYIVGSGLASLAAACFLVRDGQMKGSHIHILEAMDIAGGACDGINDPTRGYVMRGGREMENHFECLCLSTNYNRRNKDVRLYELGNIYLPKSLPVTELPDERTMFTLGMYGKGDFFDMKGVCEEFFEKIGMKKKVTYDPNSGKPFLHPGRQANMIYEGKVVGYLGEVHPAVADNYSIGEKAYIAVIDILDVLEFAGFNHKYTGIAKYPAVTRDLSLVVPHAVLAGQIEEIFDQRGGNILESYQLFDIYEGAQIEKGFKSMAYSLVFRAHDKTLGENEISAAMKKIMNGLNGLGIELRS